MSRERAHQHLLDWLKANGTEVHPSLAICEVAEEGMGCVALSDIPIDTTLFSLPRELVFSTLNAPLLSLLSPPEQETLGTGWTALILAMMYEHLDASSKWAAYFNSLPADFESLMFWSEDDLVDLKGSAVLDKIGKDDAEQDYEQKIKPLLRSRPDLFPDPATYSLDLFHRMGSCVLSRSFTVFPPGTHDADDSDDDTPAQVGEVAMVPLADVLNAKSGCDNARLFYELKTLEMHSTQHIKAGEEIYNTYADPPNSDLLRRYGHVDKMNPFDVVEISADLIAELAAQRDEALVALIAAKAEWAIEHEMDDSFALTIEDPLPDELIAAVHLFRLSATEFSKLRRKDKLQAPYPDEDRDLADAIRLLLKTREDQYPTTVEEDDALLETLLSPRRRMAVIVRCGEKRILRAANNALNDLCHAPLKPSKRLKR